MLASPAWESFTTGRPPAAVGADKWQPLETVKHTTHLLSAIRIVEDKRISAQLIYDGVLRETRTKVVYFSPNYWVDGSRYGTFEFENDWADVAIDRRMYWVDENRSRTYPMYRFMLSAQDLSALPVTPYDPVTDNGPIRLIGDKWLWATDYAAEIVVDDDVQLGEINRFSFGKHNQDMCSLNDRSCKERGYSGSDQAIKAFMGVLLGRDLHALDPLLTDNGMPTVECERALTKMYPFPMRTSGYGGLISAPDAALDIVRAAMLSIQAGDRDRVKRLMSLIIDEDTAEAAYLRLIRDHFEAPSFDWN